MTFPRAKNGVSQSGTTHWDNANGKNYTIRTNLSPTPAAGLTLLGFINGEHSPGVSFGGTAWVWDYEGPKTVKIVFSSDDWKTAKTIDAVPKGGAEWTWSAPLTRGQTVEFAGRYSVAGVVFWANNGGRNYSLDVAE